LASGGLLLLKGAGVYRFGLRVCRDGFDADDAVQEAFMKLAKRRDVIADPSALTWLMTVIRNACLRLLRPFRREQRVRDDRVRDELAATEMTPEAALERCVLVRTVHAAIARLERPYREVLVLRDLEALSGEQTCAALGIELAAEARNAKSPRWRARAHCSGSGAKARCAPQRPSES
jgi:RNA polymerase sigma-70 factor (ECF subfamily)